MLRKIILFIFAILYYSNSFADAPSLTPPSINVPKTPGTYGAQKLDWNISDTGSVAWNIPFEFPTTKQIPLHLSLNYTPTSAMGEGGNFWNLSLAKVYLDKKRGLTKYLTQATCSTSQADNIYVDGTHMLSISPGVWVSMGNSGRNVLRCNDFGGFNYYTADGMIYSFGITTESRIETPDGKGTEWVISKISTFAGNGVVNYTYSKPTYNASDLNLLRTNSQDFGFDNNIPLISIPLLQEVATDDISAKLTYEKNYFIEPETFQGFSQVMADRISKVTIYKGNNIVRSYAFEYEKSALSGRLISVQMYGADSISSMPKEVFNYKALPFQTDGEIKVNSRKIFPFSYDTFVDFFGDGIPGIIYTTGGTSLTQHFTRYTGANIFNSKDSYANIRIAKEGKILFSDNVSILKPYLKVDDATFADMAGHGALDWIDLSDTTKPAPVIFLNDFQKDSSGNILIQRAITLKPEDVTFLYNAGCGSPHDLKFADFSGSGRTDILCMDTSGKMSFLINEGFYANTASDAKPGQYILNTKQVTLANSLFTAGRSYDVKKEIKIVDWNNDGLADIVANNSASGLSVFINNGLLSQGDFSTNAFTSVYLGNYAGGSPGLPSDLTQVAFADLTGSGLPDIIAPMSVGFAVYMNNGIGKPLTKMTLSQDSDVDLSKLRVINLDGSGKNILMAPSSTTASNYVLFDLGLPTFPNMMSSVLSEDGRFIHFDYSTPQKERIEAENYDLDNEIKNLTTNQYLLPYLFPVVKQVSVSDGFNPTRITRYAYRAPSYDKSLGKFLDFGLVRKLNVGDSTQPGRLFEYRFLSGFRKGLEDGILDLPTGEELVAFEPRLTSELSTFIGDDNTKQILSQCTQVNPLINTDGSLVAEGNEWCTQLSGFRYLTKSGAAVDDSSAFTGSFSTSENITTSSQIIEPSLFTDTLLQSQGKVPQSKNNLAQILTFLSSSTVTGQSYQGAAQANITQTKTFTYDSLNRIDTTTKINDAVRTNDNAVVKTDYFCPGTHTENAFIFCNLPSLITRTGQGGEEAAKSQYSYDLSRGLLLEIYNSNQNGELKKQAWVDSYDEAGRINNFYKATGEHIHFDWSQTDSALNSTTDQDGIVTSAKYDNFGDIVHIENSHGAIQEFQYDNFLRLNTKLKNKANDGKLIASTTKNNSFLTTAYVYVKNSLLKIANSISNFVSSVTGNSTVQTDKFTYQFPQITDIKDKSTDDIQTYIRTVEAAATALPDFPAPTDFTYQTAPALGNNSVTLGFVSAEHRNKETDDLRLVNKTWLSGADEVVFSASRLDDANFAFINKSVRNSLGAIYKDFLNSNITENDVNSNTLPSITSDFQLRSTTNYYSDGSSKTIEFADGQVMAYAKGADFSLSISPEGRKTRSLYNAIGELITTQKGLDSNNNVTNDTHIMNMGYDAFSRLVSVSDNDGLLATQHFTANGLTDSLKNNRLGLARYFYDDENRLTNSNLCPLNTTENDCISTTEKTGLEKNIIYDELGKVKEQDSYRFNRSVGTNAKDASVFHYGSSQTSSPTTEIGLLTDVTVTSSGDLGVSQSVHKYIHNEEGIAVSEDLELFLGNTTKQLSVGTYQLDRAYDISDNLISTMTHGGFPRDVLSALPNDNVTGYSAKYLAGTATLESIAFTQNGTTTSTPLTGIKTNAEGFVTNLHLENNLEIEAAWNLRTQVPLALWAGDSSQLPQDLSTATTAPGLFHQRWGYDKDVFPISTVDASGQQVDALFSGNSQFAYDDLGRLQQSKGDWGEIDYSYSPGGKITKVTRSGLFVSNRISNGQNAFVDIYNYTAGDANTQDGVLSSVTSTDGKVTANLNYHADPIGFREFGVAPTLSVLASGNDANPIPSGSALPQGNNSAAWTSYEQIPMQKYVWNGSGGLQGVYAAVAKDDKGTDVDTHDLLAYRMFDSGGNLLAEFDGVQLQQLMSNLSSSGLTGGATTTTTPNITAYKLPRLVNFAGGITYERDEIHLNIGLGSFASLDLITRYPNLNATSPLTTKDVLQTKKELRINDHVGSTSIVIDIDSKKIVERNASEPYGLERGIPLISNSILAQFTAQGKRSDASLYQNSQGNMRDNWIEQGFEAVGSNPDEMRGLRNAEHFALGKFSAQTGLHSMGVRSYDPARGLWMSPDLVIGQSLEMMVSHEQEANLFQYAANNPVVKNDISGKDSDHDDGGGDGGDGDGGNGGNDGDNGDSGNGNDNNGDNGIDAGTSTKSSGMSFSGEDSSSHYGLSEGSSNSFNEHSLNLGNGTYSEDGVTHDAVTGEAISEPGIGDDSPSGLLAQSLQNGLTLYGIGKIFTAAGVDGLFGLSESTTESSPSLKVVSDEPVLVGPVTINNQEVFIDTTVDEGVIRVPAQTQKLSDLFTNRTPKASELIKFAEKQGWELKQTPTGPKKFFDNNGINRMTIKRGSSRTPGSEDPHVALRDENNKRIDPFGNQVINHSLENHTKIDWDL